jgi:hypothetical protein
VVPPSAAASAAAAGLVGRDIVVVLTPAAGFAAENFKYGTKCLAESIRQLAKCPKSSHFDIVSYLIGVQCLNATRCIVNL